MNIKEDIKTDQFVPFVTYLHIPISRQYYRTYKFKNNFIDVIENVKAERCFENNRLTAG